MKKQMGKDQMGRDDARERIKKAAPSHTAQTHASESGKNKKETASLKNKAHH